MSYDFKAEAEEVEGDLGASDADDARARDRQRIEAALRAAYAAGMREMIRQAEFRRPANIGGLTAYGEGAYDACTALANQSRERADAIERGDP